MHNSYLIAPPKKAAGRKKTSPKTQNTTSTPLIDTEHILPNTVGDISLNQLTGRGHPRKAIEDHECGEFFRPMDPDTMLLFEANLILKYPLTQDTIGTALGLLEFK